MDNREECWFYGNTTIIKLNFENSIDELYKYGCFIFTINLIFTDNNNFNYDNNKYNTVSMFNSNVDNLPKNIKIIRFGYYFNQLVNNLPHMLKQLTFGRCFNQQVDNLPSTLTQLIFDYNFNHEVDNLPCLLTHLTFGYKFNQLVYNLPQSLIHLTFGHEFNQPLNYLPQNLIHILFEKDYNSPYYSPCCNFNHNLDSLPETIENIQLPVNYALVIKKFPSNLTTISCSKYKYKKQLKNILLNKCKIIYY